MYAVQDARELVGNRRRTWLSCLALAAAIWAVPQSAMAQSIAGLVKDSVGLRASRRDG